MNNLRKSAIRNNKMFNGVFSIKKKPKVNEPGPKAVEKTAGASSGLYLFQTFYKQKWRMDRAVKKQMHFFLLRQALNRDY